MRSPSSETTSGAAAVPPETGQSVAAAPGAASEALLTESDAAVAPQRTWVGRVRPYVQIARIDHWFKNVFMGLGVMLAFFYSPALVSLESAARLAAAVFVTCIVASSNYVLNEVLDAPLDRQHPKKRFRPAAAGLVAKKVALVEWWALGALGIWFAFQINGPFGVSATALWVMGCLYNIPPVRTKEIPYVDVISESVNNPIRLALGWFALVPDRFPPVSLVLAYWMVGAFFMATKRFAEYRSIGDPARAAAYRRSFAFYDEGRLLTSMVFYVTTCALFSGVFLVRYKLELVLSVPFVAGFFAYYMALGLKEDSPVQNPERLWRERRFFAYLLFVTALFVGLMFVEIPAMYSYFGVEPSSFEPLWRID
ncbi:MAG: UbiA prenyltransferase family protein [Planctomycetota bacterium]